MRSPKFETPRLSKASENTPPAQASLQANQRLVTDYAVELHNEAEQVAEAVTEIAR